MNEHLPQTNEVPPGMQQEAGPLGLTPEQLVADTFDQANAAVRRWEGMGRLAEGVLRAVRRVKGAIALVTVGLSLGGAMEARAQEGPEILISTGWVEMIPPSRETFRIPEGGGTWIIRRTEASPVLRAFEQMRIESAAVMADLGSKLPVNVAHAAGHGSTLKAVMDMEQLIVQNTPEAEQFHDVVAKALDRLEEIQEKYDRDLEPLLEVSETASEVAQALEAHGMRSPEGITAKTKFIQSLARIGVQASFEYDISQAHAQEKR